MSGLTRRGFKELLLQNVKSEQRITCDLPVAGSSSSSRAPAMTPCWWWGWLFMGFLGFSETRQVVAVWCSSLPTAEQRLFLARSSVELEVRQWFHLAGIIRIQTSSGSFMCLWTAGRKNDYRPHLFSIDTCDLSNWHILLPMWQLFFIRTRSDLAFNMHINGIFAFWDAGGESVLYVQESQVFF